MIAKGYTCTGRADCDRGYGEVDRSAYWIPTLYKRDSSGGQREMAGDGKLELAIYYKRAGGSDDAPVNPVPQGLRIIAGDMHATTPQPNIWYKCANTNDFGRQRSLGQSFPTCSADESLVAEVQFPDCWDGKNLDSSNHKSHMAFSSGSRHVCPASHPIKVPKVFMEAKYTNANGSGSLF